MKYLFKKLPPLCLILLACLSGQVGANGGSAGADSERPGAELSNSISVPRVELARNNELAGYGDADEVCSDFKGTHAGNTIVFDLQASGGAGKYNHIVSYQLPSDFAFQEEAAGPVQFEESRRGNGTIKIEMPQLDPEVPFVDVMFFLITTDKANHSVTSSVRARISRPIILQRSGYEVQQKQSCVERYLPYVAAPGLVSNGSTNTSRLEIRQGVDQIWSRNTGWQFGVYVSPLSWLGLGNLVSLNWSYFENRSKQVTESTYVSSSYDLDPGDFLQVYIQPTRHVTAYDAHLVKPCGQSEKKEGVYKFQWWSFSYHVYPIDPHAEDPYLDPTLVGAPVVNTCEDSLSEDDFIRTN